MSYKGTVKNGVVVLEPSATLVEGTAVRVVPVSVEKRKPVGSEAASTDELDPVWRMAELATDTGIPDLAVNLDHYLYGHPKVTDGR